jgi:hypothetical protein
MKTIELALFKLKPEAKAADFDAALAASDAWLAQQPGFVLRRHGRSGTGERLDYVEWDSMEAAEAAAKAFVEAPELRSFMEAVDMQTASMRHFDLLC